jgi:regulator of telomere elongation helicase 1
MNELGYTIRNFCSIVPEGLLIFFPSYTVMDQLIKHWNNSKIWSTMSNHKELLIEPRSSSEFNAIIKDFEIKSKIGKGCAFFAVCRGKASEGIDFSDHCARAVVLTGMPYPPLYDPKIKLKKDYLDANVSRCIYFYFVF